MLRSIVSVRGMLVKSDFKSKLAKARLGSNSSTSLANENESFIVYSLTIICLSNLSQNFANLEKFSFQNWPWGIKLGVRKI